MEAAGFEVAAASLLGREHLRRERANQDGVVVRAAKDRLVAVVADGCSSGRASEVGAKLGAAHLARVLAEADPERAPDPAAATDALLAYVEQIAIGVGGDLASAVQDYLLFTFLAAVIDPDRTVVFGIGDGVVSVDGAARVLEAGHANAPPYLAYRLVPRALEDGYRPDLAPVVHHDGPTKALRSLVIATDGAADLPLEDLLADTPSFDNPTLLERRLRALSSQKVRLADDTSLVLVRRARP